MKLKDIKVGGHYLAKVSGKLTTVRVEDIRQVRTWNNWDKTRIDVTNLATGRKSTFRSAAKLRKEIPARGTPEYNALSPMTLQNSAVEALAEGDLEKNAVMEIMKETVGKPEQRERRLNALAKQGGRR